MWEILEVLRRLHRGESQVVIEAATGRDRKTIRSYLRVAREIGWQPGGAEPDEALAVRLLEKLRPGPRNLEPGEMEHLLLPRQEQIRQWISGTEIDRGLTLTKIQRLLRGQGIDVHYSSLYRFAVKYCQFGKGRITVRCALTQPGEVSEIDFGRLGYIFDPETERHRMLWALVVVLIYSRHMYVHITPTQKLEDVIDGLEAAWDFFGGLTARVILDNLKAAIIKAERYEPIFQRTFAEYAVHRGFVIDPAAAYHPQGKPHVERQVPYVRENFFRGESWLNREHVQREATRWCLEIAGTRIHGTTRRRPLAVFEEEERATLLPIIGERFDTPHWAECTVHPDHHVQFGKALYSVPTEYLRKRVTVRGDRALVRIFSQGKLIKTHAVQKPGGRSTDYQDYPKHLATYARRDPDYVIAEAKKLGTSIGRFTETLLSGDFPWAKLRQAQKLLRLAQKYGRHRLEEACSRALAFDLINVRRVESILLRALQGPSPSKPGSVVPLPTRFLRPPGSFSHSPQQEEIAFDGDQAVTQSCTQASEALGDPGHTPRSRDLFEESQPDSRGLPGADPPR
jgi:hypothetical protein